ncbi:hypothetical protein J4443_00140 [Candidatus Woesearchaeota archaeon]|nr:hypothetical protein [Candidatus Woesearchaeota archaeon]
MKRYIIVLFLFLFLQSALAYELKQGELVEFENRKITAVSLQQSKAVIQVDDEKNIINLGQSEVISGVKISVVDILYTGDQDSRITFNAVLTYACGDSVCNPGETQQNCCQDCKCSSSDRCTSSGCVLPQCFLSEDCNDNKELTKDTCEEYKCKHQNIRCSSNNQCNDNNPDTDDLCSSGECQNLPPICKTDEDCTDPNPCTLDQCINKDCQYNPIPNCTPPEEKKKEEIKQEQEEEQEEIIELTTETDSNFFKRIVNWFKNLF